MSTQPEPTQAPETPAPAPDKSALRTVLLLLVPAFVILVWAMFFKSN